MDSIFLTPDDLRVLTGRARARHQVDALRSMGIAHWVNAAGRPIVARAAIEGYRGRQATAAPAPTWTPKPLRA